MELVNELFGLANPVKASLLRRFFKTSKGQYGEGDQFLGIVVPIIRRTIKKYYSLSLEELVPVLTNPYHEIRLAAFLILVHQYQQAKSQKRLQIYKTYIRCRGGLNNWDLIDLTAPHIVGHHCFHHHTYHPLDSLARGSSIWDKRIAILATFYHLRQNDPAATLRIVTKLLTHDHDLIQKANGWMLRELGKNCGQALLLEFIQRHYPQIPRTTLRYAIEKFPLLERKQILLGNC